MGSIPDSALAVTFPWPLAPTGALTGSEIALAEIEILDVIIATLCELLRLPDDTLGLTGGGPPWPSHQPRVNKRRDIVDVKVDKLK